MPPPEAHLRVADCEVLLLGTVPGFVPDGERVRTAAAALRPEAVAVGVPREDLEVLAQLQADPEAAAALPGLDDADTRFMALLGRHGATQVVPSPDLAAAATVAPVHAVDLDDDAHAEAFTRRVRVRHLMQRTRVERRLLTRPFDDAQDAYTLALEWDTHLCRVKGLARVEADREAAMAHGIQEAAAHYARLLAVVPAPRFAGVLSRLRAKA